MTWLIERDKLVRAGGVQCESDAEGTLTVSFPGDQQPDLTLRETQALALHSILGDMTEYKDCDKD